MTQYNHKGPNKTVPEKSESEEERFEMYVAGFKRKEGAKKQGMQAASRS